MIMCNSCQDWFHGDHLTPQYYEDESEEDFMLICSKCINSLGGLKVVLPYFDKLHPDVIDHLGFVEGSTEPNKR